MLLEALTKDGATSRNVTGLYNARVGDIIEIGIEGTRHKMQTKIAKVTEKKVTDREGNIFHRDGNIFRRKSWQAVTLAPGKKVYAKHVTQKNLDDGHHKDRLNYLKKYRWENLDEARLKQVLSILRVDFGTVQKRIPYMDDK